MITLKHICTIAAIVLTTACGAQELVFRPGVGSIDRGDDDKGSFYVGNLHRAAPLDIRSPGCESFRHNEDQCVEGLKNNANSFYVYRVDQADATTKVMRDQIAQLQSNIKSLSDANDALTKRISDIEVKSSRTSARMKSSGKRKATGGGTSLRLTLNRPSTDDKVAPAQVISKDGEIRGGRQPIYRNRGART